MFKKRFDLFRNVFFCLLIKTIYNKQKNVRKYQVKLILFILLKMESIIMFTFNVI